MKVFNGVAKWIVVLLLALSAGLLVIIFLSPKPEISAYLLRLILLAAVGFISGLIVRLFFRGISAIAAIFLSLIASLIAVLIIDHFYETGYQFQFLGNDFRFQVPKCRRCKPIHIDDPCISSSASALQAASNSIPKPQKAPKTKKVHKTFSQLILPYLTKADPRNWKVWKQLQSKKADTCKNCKS